MNERRRLTAIRATCALASLIALSIVAGCTSTEPRAAISKNSTRSKEYFSEAEYGVKASPLVSTKRSRLPRGGGRDQLGKPYKIAGKWYTPKEQPGYSKKGKASWYGDAFHGRLTANGEIYDMTHLTAAHPTMPLPSYARVTNLKNGSSVIVRINDRGPYAHGRIIDLSKRAAEMLDYTHSGIADVKVDYVGRAPLDGRDDQYLIASYRRGKSGPDASDGLASGVMIAMAGPTPSVGVQSVPAFPGAMTTSTQIAANGVELPEYGPVIYDRPIAGLTRPLRSAGDPALGYAERRIGAAVEAVSDMGAGGLAPAAIVESWRRKGGAAGGEFIAVGTYASRQEAEMHLRAASDLGRAEIEATDADGVTTYSLSLHATGQADVALQRLWSAGETDAFVVRD